jgi:hypothetical protein
MNATQSKQILSLLEAPVITIHRNLDAHCWAIVIGSHEKQLPWSDDASAVSVILWLKAKANGNINVEIVH